MGLGTAIFSIFIIIIALRMWPVTAAILAVLLPVSLLLILIGGIVVWKVTADDRHEYERQERQKIVEEQNADRAAEERRKELISVQEQINNSLKLGMKYSNMPELALNFFQVNPPQSYFNFKHDSLRGSTDYYYWVGQVRYEFKKEKISGIYNSYLHTCKGYCSNLED